MTDFLSKLVGTAGQQLTSLAEKAEEHIAQSEPLKLTCVKLKALQEQLDMLDLKDAGLLRHYQSLQLEAEQIIETGIIEPKLPFVLEYYHQVIITSRRWEKRCLEKARQFDKQPFPPQGVQEALFKSYLAHQRFTDQRLSSALKLCHSLKIGLGEKAQALLAQYQQKWQSYQSDLQNDRPDEDGEYQDRSRYRDIKSWSLYLRHTTPQGIAEKNKKALLNSLRTSLPRGPYSEALRHGHAEWVRRLGLDASGARPLPTWANPTTVRRYYMTAMQMMGAMSIGDRLSVLYKKKSASFVELADLGFEIMLPMLGIGTMKELARRGIPVLGQIMGAAAITAVGEDLADQSISNARRELNGTEPVWNLRLMRLGIHFLFYVDAGLMAAPFVNMGRGPGPRALGEGTRLPRSSGRGAEALARVGASQSSAPGRGSGAVLANLGADAVADETSALVEGAAAATSTPTEGDDNETALAVRESGAETDTDGVGETEGAEETDGGDGNIPWQERFVALLEEHHYNLDAIPSSFSSRLDSSRGPLLPDDHPLVLIVAEAGGYNALCEYYIEWLEQNWKKIAEDDGLDNINPIFSNNFDEISNASAYASYHQGLSPLQKLRCVQVLFQLGSEAQKLEPAMANGKNDEVYALLQESRFTNFLELQRGGVEDWQLEEFLDLLPQVIDRDDLQLFRNTPGFFIIRQLSQELYRHANPTAAGRRIHRSRILQIMDKLVLAIRPQDYADENEHRCYAFLLNNFIKDYRPQKDREFLCYPALFLASYLGYIQDGINEKEGDGLYPERVLSSHQRSEIIQSASLSFISAKKFHSAKTKEYAAVVEEIKKRLDSGHPLTLLEREAYAQWLSDLAYEAALVNDPVPGESMEILFQLMGSAELNFVFPVRDGSQDRFTNTLAFYVKNFGATQVLEKIKNKEIVANPYLLFYLLTVEASALKDWGKAWQKLCDCLSGHSQEERINTLIKVIEHYLESYNRIQTSYDLHHMFVDIARKLSELESALNQTEDREELLTRQAMDFFWRYPLR